MMAGWPTRALGAARSTGSGRTSTTATSIRCATRWNSDFVLARARALRPAGACSRSSARSSTQAGEAEHAAYVREVDPGGARPRRRRRARLVRQRLRPRRRSACEMPYSHHAFELGFGLLRADGSEKPVVRRAARAAPLVDGGRPRRWTRPPARAAPSSPATGSSAPSRSRGRTRAACAARSCSRTCWPRRPGSTSTSSARTTRSTATRSCSCRRRRSCACRRGTSSRRRRAPAPPSTGPTSPARTSSTRARGAPTSRALTGPAPPAALRLLRSARRAAHAQGRRSRCRCRRARRTRAAPQSLARLPVEPRRAPAVESLAVDGDGPPGADRAPARRRGASSSAPTRSSATSWRAPDGSARDAHRLYRLLADEAGSSRLPDAPSRRAGARARRPARDDLVIVQHRGWSAARRRRQRAAARRRAALRSRQSDARRASAPRARASSACAASASSASIPQRAPRRAESAPSAQRRREAGEAGGDVVACRG